MSKCWECKKRTSVEIGVITTYYGVNYYDGIQEKKRWLCPGCYKRIKPYRNKLGYVKVDRIRDRKLGGKKCIARR